MAKDNPLDLILLVGGIVGVAVYHDEILAFLKDKLGHPNPSGDCPTGQHKDDNDNCVPDDTNPPDLNATHIYPTTGKTCSCSTQTQDIHCSGTSSKSVRTNCNSCNLSDYEATAIIQFGGGCTNACGDEATIKHWGPTHQDGNCCWALSAVMQNGDCCFGGEGPHPSTTKCQKKLGNVGNLSGKKVAIKSVIWKTGSGGHQELYVDVSGSGKKWRKMGERDFSKWGESQTTNKISSSQQVEFRVDCAKAKWLSNDVAEIKPGTSGSTSGMYDNFRLT